MIYSWTNTNMENKSIYLGLTGRMGSGKGEIISMLTQEFDFCDISLSDIVREEAAKTNREINRLTMQDIGNRLRKKEGAGVLGKRIYQKISRSNKEKWIIDGIRNPAEITELKKLQKFYLIGITTDLDILIGRIQNRRRQTDMADREEINNRLEREWGKNEPAEGQQVGKCLEYADYTIKNNGTLVNLKEKVIYYLKELNII